LTAAEIRELARACGFELAGVAAASSPPEERERYRAWVDAGFAGEMRYLTDRRAAVRDDPRNLLASARSIICVGKLYNTPWPYSTRYSDPALAWISRYAWGGDYHGAVRLGLERMVGMLRERAGAGFESRIAVDTVPLLERSYARLAGLGWIGKNTCLINQGRGSWFFLGELLVSLEIAPDAPPPDRCGTCRRCIEACPTAAIVPAPAGTGWAVDSRLCISYFTIELRGGIPEERRAGLGRHVFGCDICQDVCPWNRCAPATADEAFQPRHAAPPLAMLAGIGEEEFGSMFRATPVTRARYAGFLRNVAVAMGNSGLPEFRAPLERLASYGNPLIAEHARWALERIQEPAKTAPLRSRLE
jgi:epoxyqueuosine reductase